MTLGGLAAQYDPRFVLLSTSFFAEVELLHEAVRRLRAAWPEAALVLGGQFLLELRGTLSVPAFELALRRLGADAYVLSPRAEQGRNSAALQLADALATTASLALAGTVFAQLHRAAPQQAFALVFALAALLIVLAAALAPRVRHAS